MTAPNEALRTILPIAGWGDGHPADVVFTGCADPVLPPPCRIGAAGAAALAASGLAATELWQARTGRRQRVTVDLRQATAALRSSQYIRLAGTGVSSARNTNMGFYPTPRHHAPEQPAKEAGELEPTELHHRGPAADGIGNPAPALRRKGFLAGKPRSQQSRKGVG